MNWQQLNFSFVQTPRRIASRINACMFVLALLVGLLAPARIIVAQEELKNQKLPVEQLIRQLDSPRYVEREKAMGELRGLGANAIRPLAEKLIDGTPESCARIKQILPAIAMRSGRDELFQVLAILNLRFNLDFQEMNTLVSKWTVTRRQVAIGKLRESGAEVVDEFDDSEDFRRAQLRVARMIAVEPRPVIVRPQGGIQIQIGGDQFKQLSKPALGKPNSENAVDPKKQSENVAIDVALAERLNGSAEENERWLKARNLGREFLNADATAAQLPVKVILSTDWNGRLAALDQTIAISELVFKEIELTPELFVSLAKQSVQRVIFENCLLSAGEEKFQLPAGLRSIVVQQAGGAAELLGRITDEQRDIFQLKLVGGNESQQAFGESLLGFRSIYNLELENFNLDGASFDQIAKLSKLKVLTLNRCKFAPADYREFDLARKTLRKTFTGKALLGVRGLSGALVGPEQSTCQVTDVVAGAAADQAGVEAGDIILRIGKHSVKVFDDLRLLIAGYDIGDEIEIEVLRNGKKLGLKAKLGDPQAVGPLR